MGSPGGRSTQIYRKYTRRCFRGPVNQGRASLTPSTEPNDRRRNQNLGIWDRLYIKPDLTAARQPLAGKSKLVHPIECVQHAELLFVNHQRQRLETLLWNSRKSDPMFALRYTHPCPRLPRTTNTISLYAELARKLKVVFVFIGAIAGIAISKYFDRRNVTEKFDSFLYRGNRFVNPKRARCSVW